MLTCTYNTTLAHSRIISHNQPVLVQYTRKYTYFLVYCTRDAGKSLAQPGRKQARKHARDGRDFNNIEMRAAIKLFFLQGKAPEEILTETLDCFLPGRGEGL